MDLREVPSTPFQRHPWEVARARFFGRVLEKECAGRPVQVLDVGAGDGYFATELLARLAPGSGVTCVDAHYRDEDLAARLPPGITRARVPPEGQRSDVLFLLDVIEHVPDDLGFLRGLVEGSLARNARVLVSVPAWQPLFTEHDVKLGHYRRYAPRECREVLAKAGLRVVRSGGLFHSLLVPRALAKAKELVRPPRAPADANGTATDAGAWNGGAAVTKLVGAALAIDTGVSRALAAGGVPMPGLSFWALCERR